MPFKGPELHTVPGLLEVQRLDGLHHYLVLDQDAGVERFLREAGPGEASGPLSIPVRGLHPIDAPRRAA